MDLIMNNLGNIIVGGILVFVVYKIVKYLKNNDDPCAGCPSAKTCPKKTCK